MNAKSQPLFPFNDEETMNWKSLHWTWDELHRMNSSSTKIVVLDAVLAWHCVQCKFLPLPTV